MTNGRVEVAVSTWLWRIILAGNVSGCLVFATLNVHLPRYVARHSPQERGVDEPIQDDVGLVARLGTVGLL